MFKGLCGPESLILHNPDLVTPDPDLPAQHRAIRAESLAEQELGDAVFANVIFLGALSSKLEIISRENLLRALHNRLPQRFHDKNLLAFDLGVSL
jgi:2-oxoglutarate ferredoxin oxidoreductase subunit gamma